jgi:uncharacterized protein YbjT (DUF2867 family)
MSHAENDAGSDRRADPPGEILVLGATGMHGGAVARALLSTGAEVLGFTRDRESARAVALERDGARLAAGSLDDTASIAAAMRGVRACYAVTTPFEGGSAEEVRQGENVIRAAEDAGLPWLVLASVASARDADVPHFKSKARIERSLELSAASWTIVAPTYFYENVLGAGDLDRGVLSLPLPADMPLQQIALNTLGQFVAELLEHGAAHRGDRIELAADEPTPREMASSLGVRLEQITLADVAARSRDIAAMYRFLGESGYSVDIASLKLRYPQVVWERFAAWAAEHRPACSAAGENV